jgi:tRNA G46 methylase TrmB
MFSEERVKSRKKILAYLRKFKKEAYSNLTCVEYDAICVLIQFIELKELEDLNKI